MVMKTGELVGVGLEDGWEKYLTDMTKNKTAASPNNNNTGNKIGDDLVEPFAID
jgi:hypothetical protein